MTFDVNSLSRCALPSKLLERSEALGAHAAEVKIANPCRKQIRIAETDCNKFYREMSLINPPGNPNDFNNSVTQLNEIIQEKMKASKHTNRNRNVGPGDRWQRMLQSKDSKEIWGAIDWKGNTIDCSTSETPTSSEFKFHFESLLNPNQELPQDLLSLCDGPSIPILDNPIAFDEFAEAASDCKSSSSGGPSGIPAAIFKYLPVNWIEFLCLLLNAIFLSRTFPILWCFSRLVTIFKSGVRKACDNYRGLSIMDSLAKIYDRILCKRLEMWFTPDREQAGAQKGRSCIEWIIVLRLLLDYAVFRKVKLFIVFVDFSKAYDRVPRSGLIRVLKSLGCGVVMLCAIAAMYQDTQLILGAAIISVTLGVKQGSPSSCFLFTLYVNPLIRELKAKCGVDGFLGTLHCLLLMDDTIILSTSREGVLKKLDILTDFCDQSGMKINMKKTKFMVVNGDDQDKLDLTSNGITVKNCDFYVYLGAVFSQTGKLLPSLQKHCDEKFCHVLKFVAFVTKNSLFPFHVKILVMKAALFTSVLYGCESWLGNDLKPVQGMYFSAIKALLGVRRTTANDLCLIELGLPSLSGYVKDAQFKFLKRILAARIGMDDDPFMFAYKLCDGANTPCARYIRKLINSPGNFVADDIDTIKNRIRASQRTKFKTYLELNPELSVHSMYSCSPYVNDLQRTSVTRIRLSSHNLAVETGRWARIDRDRRLCSCGEEIQTESHVICGCMYTEHLRNNSNLDFTDLPNFFSGDPRDVCAYVHKVVDIFEH